MIVLYICLCELVFICLSYIFVKTYQLSGYQPHIFLRNVFEFKLAFGDKNRLYMTKRMLRFWFVLILLSSLIIFLILFFIDNIYLKLLDILIIFLCQPFFTLLSHYILLPIEILIKKYYISKASHLLQRKKIFKIGITGSYGKTSTKTILSALLEKKFKVLSTPKNYNTEMGITKTILQGLDNQQIFIAEMGAREIGDIKILAEIVRPDCGIITTIGNQHLETFKTIENIEKTKYELAEGIKPNGFMVFNGDSPSTQKLYEQFEGEKYLTCSEGGFAYAKNIVTSKNGSEFVLVVDQKEIEIKSKLLGRCNINNIVTASALAYKLGLSLKQISDVISNLSPARHRLELIENGFCTIIDDSYNSNLIGSKMALDEIKQFEGEKIVITPGIVELGASQSEENFKLGGMIADVADHMIIMNQVNKNDLLSGAISHNFKREHIYFADSRKKQKEILDKIISKNCVVLFENDLPDNYK